MVVDEVEGERIRCWVWGCGVFWGEIVGESEACDKQECLAKMGDCDAVFC